MLKTLYIRKADESFWLRAEERATAQGMALSVYLSELLRVHTYRIGTGEEAEPTVDELLGDAASTIKKARKMISNSAEVTV